MKGKALIAAVAVFILLIGAGGYAGYRYLFSQPAKVVTGDSDDATELLPPVPDTVKVTAERSAGEDNSINLEIAGLNSGYSLIEYEVMYESEGIIQGVNSGSKPLDVAGEDSFSREIYLGTCSKNVCRPHPGVASVTVTLEFTDTDGKRSQFSGEFPL